MNRREFLVKTVALPTIAAVPSFPTAVRAAELPADWRCLQVAFLDSRGALLLGNGYRWGTILFCRIASHILTNAGRFSCTLAAGTPFPWGIGVWDLAGSPVYATGVSQSTTMPQAERGTQIDVHIGTLNVVLLPPIAPVLYGGKPS